MMPLLEVGDGSTQCIQDMIYSPVVGAICTKTPCCLPFRL